MTTTVSAEVNPVEDTEDQEGMYGVREGTVQVFGQNMADEHVFMMAAHALAMEYGLDLETTMGWLDEENADIDTNTSTVSYSNREED